MRLIITRPEEDAVPLAHKLALLGHEALLVPLFEIVEREAVVLQRACQAVCITSANAMRWTGDVAHLFDVPLLCVGPQSKAAAIGRGFRKVSAHGGDVDGLVLHIMEALSAQDGPILYLSGAETSGDLEGKLSSAGFAVDRVIVYDARPLRPSLIPEADGALLYSPRAARLWGQYVPATRGCQLMHFCLSANVARQLPEDWPRVVAQRPDEQNMLALLDRDRETE